MPFDFCSGVPIKAMPPKATRARPPRLSLDCASIIKTRLPFSNDSSAQTSPAIPAPMMIISDEWLLLVLMRKAPVFQLLNLDNILDDIMDERNKGTVTI